MTNIQQLKRLSIRDYLSRRGVRPARENDRCGFYLSPLRTEHTPSFKMDYALNLWYDFGTDKGGSIIDLVMGLENCDCAEAIRRLRNGETEQGIPVSLFHRKQSDNLWRPFLRSAFSPMPHSSMRHCLATLKNGVSTRRPFRPIVGKCVIPSAVSPFFVGRK